MEDMEAVDFLFVVLSLFGAKRWEEESQRRLQAARDKTKEKYLRVWEALQQDQTEDDIKSCEETTALGALPIFNYCCAMVG